MTVYVEVDADGRPLGFYRADVHGARDSEHSRIPENAIEITDDLWQSWLPHTHCKALRAGGVLVDVPQRTAPWTTERARQICERTLFNTAHRIALDEPEAIRDAWLAYRAQIRAIRDAGTVPEQWPTPPEQV